MTASVGQFVLQVVSVKPPDGVEGLWFPLPRRFTEHAVALWPLAQDERNPKWPPPSELDGSLMNAFMGRFATE
jgi:hypothetical protein